jgi:hypothetical protein
VHALAAIRHKSHHYDPSELTGRANDSYTSSMALVRWVGFLLLAGCGSDASSRVSSRDTPDAAVTGADGSNSLVPSACIFNQGGPPQPSIKDLDPGTIEVGCAGRVSADVMTIQDIAGQGFDWMASVNSPNHFFTPDPTTGSACPGFVLLGTGACGVTVAPPPGAVPGDSDEGTLTVVTSDPSIGPITAHVRATVVATSFRVAPSTLDFGTVTAGQSASIAVTVVNTGTVPILLSPAPTPTPPFSVQYWGPHSEDSFTIPELAPGQSGEMLTFVFSPKVAGMASLDLDLTPFPTDQSVPPACGSLVHLSLKGDSVASPGDAGASP